MVEEWQAKQKTPKIKAKISRQAKHNVVGSTGESAARFLWCLRLSEGRYAEVNPGEGQKSSARTQKSSQYGQKRHISLSTASRRSGSCVLLCLKIEVEKRGVGGVEKILCEEATSSKHKLSLIDISFERLFSLL